ncbi:exo-beta-N-acetylmuramidase NamZ domain-containing protein [Pontibacillus salicampi]|uniref:Exo-beta-N-acetylmuramidase NamZ domain-containing protein n=1 Tax=Pontibacillus salicampi TaxID=1449801 RepID=A0ABV6LMM7_9BACI
MKRILKLKLDKGIIKKEEPTPVQEKIQAAEETVGAKSHKQIEQQAADRSITLIKNEEVLPLEKEKEEIVVIGRSFQKELFESVSQHQSNVTSISLDSDYDLSEEEWDKVKKADVIIVGTYTYNVSTRAKDSNQMQMVREVMNNTEGHVIGVGIRNPYDIMAYPEIDAFVAQYGFRKASFDATAKVIFGETSPSGALPVTILDDSGEVLYPYGHRVNADKEEEEFFQLGVEKFLEEHKDLVKGKKVGLITNPTGVDQQLRSVVDTLHEDEGVQLTALYGPEHGVRGSAQAGDYVESYTDEKTGLPVYSLYGETRKPTKEMLENIDTLLFDIQDVGTRFYTYIYTMALAMEAAGENDIEFVVLDRPNPLSGDKVEGPVLNPAYSSFVGKYPIPLRHGMTVGELAQLFNEEYKLGADLKVIQMDQYDRGMSYKDTGLEFVMPSPNMPTLDTAMVYPGAALIEGTNVSEGRGTTRPFELIGAPFIESTAIAATLNEQQLPGVRFRASSFTPSFSKYEGELVHGVQIHVTNPNTYQPVKTGLHVVKIIHDQYPEQFAFRAEDSQGVSFFDKLIGNGWVRQAIEDGKSVDYMVEKWKKELDEFKELREEYLLYE